MFDNVMPFLEEQMATNQFLQGGMLMGLVMAGWAWLRSWPSRIWGWIVYHFTVELDIPDTDKAFRWVNEWLAEHHYSQKRARRLTVSTVMKPKALEGASPAADVERRVVIMTPAPGRHWIFHRRRLLILHRKRDTSTDQGDMGGRRKPFMETFTIRVIGRDRAPAMQLIADAQKQAQPTRDEIEISQACNAGYWDPVTKRRTRPAESVILDGATDQILTDIQEFLENRAWYIERGIPFRRGILLHGAPGNGKTSLIVAIASHFKMGLGYLGLTTESMTDGALLHALATSPPNTLIVIEDVDCLFKERDTEKGVGITFSGFLNALDGVASAEGRVLVMTTNHKDQLDPALIRPGRIDVEIKFHNATESQAVCLFDRFYPNTEGSIDFGHNLPANTSMAQLQGHLILHKDDPQAAITSLPALGVTNESTEEQTQTTAN